MSHPLITAKLERKACRGPTDTPHDQIPEGYALAFELREGKQHSQKGTPPFMVQCHAQAIIAHQWDAAEIPRTLVRLDSGHDSTDNIDVIRKEGADFFIVTTSDIAGRRCLNPLGFRDFDPFRMEGQS
jgi:hypothetical protein